MSTREKILAATVVIFFVCVIVWAVRTTPPTPPPMEKVEPPTVMEYEGNTLVEEKDGRIIWELTCDKLDWFADMEMLIAAGNVKISKDDMQAFGDMAYSQTALNKFGIMGNAKILKGVENAKSKD